MMPGSAKPWPLAVIIMTLISEIKKPFNLVTLALTVFSIVLSFLFYNKAKKGKSLSYSLNEPTSLIYDSKNSIPAITIYEKDSIPIKGSIFLLTGTIWNSGDFPILKSDLRMPLSLTLTSNRILDYKLIKIKDSTIAKFVLQKTTDNSLSLDWNYFDPNFGFIFQIIYVGESNPGFELTGKVLDISGFRKVAIKEEGNSLLSIGAICLFSLLFIFQLYQLYKNRNEKRRILRLILIVQVIVPLIGVAFSVWDLFFFSYGAYALLSFFSKLAVKLAHNVTALRCQASGHGKLIQKLSSEPDDEYIFGSQPCDNRC